jgi:3-hydroxypropanoate dehydrogenase
VLASPVNPTTASRLDAVGRRLLFTDAHTVKRFASTPVGDDQLTEVWDLAKWPPTMFNVQPLRVLFVRTPRVSRGSCRS